MRLICIPAGPWRQFSAVQPTSVSCFDNTVVSTVLTYDSFNRVLVFDFILMPFTRASDGNALNPRSLTQSAAPSALHPFRLHLLSPPVHVSTSTPWVLD